MIFKQKLFSAGPFTRQWVRFLAGILWKQDLWENAIGCEVASIVIANCLLQLAGVFTGSLLFFKDHRTAKESIGGINVT